MKNIGHHIPHTMENMPKKPHTGSNDTLLPPPMMGHCSCLAITLKV